MVFSMELGQVPVDDRDVGLKPHGHARGVGAGDAAADHHDLGRGHARHAAEQQARAALFLLQAVRADLDRHAAGHLAHGREQGQAPVAVGHGLIGDGDAAGIDQTLGLGQVGSQMQVGEEQLALAQQLVLARLRFLDLHDHLGLFEDRLRRARDLRANGAVGVVVESDAGPGAGLHQHLMTMVDQLPRGAGRQADAVLMILDLLRHADEHDAVSSDRFSLF
jgi:hypothetical protein